MFRCERRSRGSQLAASVEIRRNWDQSFVGESDREVDEIISRFQQRCIYENVTTVRQLTQLDERCSNQQTEDAELSRCYVNVPRCLDTLVVPQTGAGTIPLRADLSPMSLRAPTADMSSGPSSTVAQLALSRLKESGFYYESISPSQARQLLQPHPPGTFLVRASSDRRFLFSLSVRTSGISYNCCCNTFGFCLDSHILAYSQVRRVPIKTFLVEKSRDTVVLFV